MASASCRMMWGVQGEFACMKTESEPRGAGKRVAGLEAFEGGAAPGGAAPGGQPAGIKRASAVLLKDLKNYKAAEPFVTRKRPTDTLTTFADRLGAGLPR